MGSFLFRWPYPANDVHVSGTFDDWGKSEQLNKVGDHWEKEVNLPSADEKVLYKFVVDKEWVVDDNAPKEDDGHYNINNVLYPQDIKKHTSEPAAVAAGVGAAGVGAAAIGGTAFGSRPETNLSSVEDPHISTVGPDSTTAKMAGDVPLQSSTEDPGISTVGPDSTSAKMAGEVPLESGTKDPQISTIGPDSTTAKMAGEVPLEQPPPLERKMSPPGAFPETPATEPESFSVAPIPATSDIGNPVDVPAGEKVPDSGTLTSNTVDSTATTSKEDYEKDASSTNPDAFGVAPIPASSGIGNPVDVPAGEKVPDPSTITSNNINSTATTSKEDYEKDASAPIPPESKDQEVSVNPIPGTSGIGNPISLPAGEKVPDSSDLTSNTVDSTATTSKADYEKAGGIGAGVIGGGALGAFAASAFSKPSETNKNIIPESSLPMNPDNFDVVDKGPTISSVGPGSTTAAMAGEVPLEKKRQGMVIDPSDAPGADETTAPAVPAMVKESMRDVHEGPEAAASAEAVKEKSAMEKELLSKTTSSDATGEPASAAAAQTSYYGLATAVPPEVEKSMSEAHAAPEAASSSSAVAEKSAMERELMKKVPSAEGVGEPAPTIAAATSATAPTATKSEDKLPGTSSVAAAAVSDGTDGTATPLATGISKAVPVEKSEGDAAEYAPVKDSATAPGVAPAAAAAVADGTEDPTLADEPAVKMMNQQDAEAMPPANAVEPSTEAAAPVTPVKPTTTDGAADLKKADNTPTAGPMGGVVAAHEATTKKDTTSPTAGPMGGVVGAPTRSAAASASAEKAPTPAASSPATSSTKDAEMKKKKKHRISGFFKKIFD